MGQARMAHPEVVLPQAVALLKGVPDPAQQQLLFQVLLTLMTDEEGLKMLDPLLATDDLGLDTALGRIRRRECEEGRVEGREEGRVEGVRTTLLDLLYTRSNASPLDGRTVPGREDRRCRKPIVRSNSWCVPL